MENTDTIVIGAGPAGSVCAYLLKKAGVDCVLVDFASFPRDKICGGGLTPKAYSLLAELMPDLQYEYRAIKKVKMGLDHKPISEIELPQEIRIVSRKDFDNALLQQYLNEGGTFIQDAFEKFELLDDGNIVVRLRSGREFQCKHLVGADGANSRVRRQLIGKYDGNVLILEQYIDSTNDAIEGVVSRKYDRGYYYLFPSVHCDIVGLGYKGITLQEFRNVLTLLGIKETQIKGANISVEETDSGLENVTLIGDAGGFPNKLSYEGLYYAIATGRNASDAISKGKPFKETNCDIFKRKRKERFLSNLFYGRIGMFLVRHFSSNTYLVRKIFVAGLSH